MGVGGTRSPHILADVSFSADVKMLKDDKIESQNVVEYIFLLLSKKLKSLMQPL